MAQLNLLLKLHAIRIISFRHDAAVDGATDVDGDFIRLPVRQRCHEPLFVCHGRNLLTVWSIEALDTVQTIEKNSKVSQTKIIR
jgi:hypothetical protein